MSKEEVGYINGKDWGLKLVLEEGRLRRITFGTAKQADNAIGEASREARRQLEKYLTGAGREFTLELDIRGTEFQKKVWNALREIPYGETRTYREIAERIGHPLAARAVGQAAHKNPLPIVIPCHRLVGSNGALTGYAGGLELKRSLLALERSHREGR